MSDNNYQTRDLTWDYICFLEDTLRLALRGLNKPYPRVKAGSPTMEERRKAALSAVRLALAAASEQKP